MKRSITLFACSMAWLALGCQAEPVRKASAPKAVDLEAAAKATAALYATPLVTQSATAPAVQRALSAVAVPPRPVRSSPLLPAPAPEQGPGTAPTPLANQETPAEVWAGSYHCERAEKVTLLPGSDAGLVELRWKNQRWPLRRVDSLSGAMRLEDASARMVWIQLGNKSMLLDQRLGKRLLDECQHDIQVQTAVRMKNNPPPALFDTTGMGR